MKGWLKIFLKVILVFAILFDINFIFLPSVTTARLAFLLLLGIAVMRRDKISKPLLYFILVVGVILTYSVIQGLIWKDFTQSSRLFWFAIYGLLTPFFISKIFTTRNQFFVCVTIAVAMQAILSILSFVNPAVKGILYSLVVFTANFDESLTLRAVGFSSAAGATLSVIQSVGVISALILLKYNSFNLLKSLVLWLSIILIVLSTFIIGRTGLFISIFAIGIYLLSIKLRVRTLAIAILTIILLTQLNYIRVLERYTSNVEGFDIALFTDWITNAFSIKDNATAEDLSGMPVPPITAKTIIGTGRVVNEQGNANASENDSGYIQTYYSLGLVVAVIFYFSYLLFLLHAMRNKKKKVLFLLLFILFIIEIKEPFMFQYMLPLFVLSTIYMINKTGTGEDLQALI